MSGRDESLFLGVDGGGSKTLAIVVDGDGRERGRGGAAGSNHHSAGLMDAVAQVEHAVRQALDTAGANLPVAGAWLGLAGVDHAADETMLLPHLHHLSPALRLTNDAELLLGALPDAMGVALIAGTGAIALGRDKRGGHARASGWGHLIGDEGSGFAIGYASLRAATRMADGRGPATSLLSAIIETWELTAPSDMIAHVYTQSDKAKIARLAPLALSAWRAGDAAAGRIVRHAAAELALAVLAVDRRSRAPWGIAVGLWWRATHPGRRFP